ncbi:MAG: hypothetical protein HY329_18000 [Chloroflexi bacterium]|nr:hypothetical protein [Chloroflexota bacterium]
MAGNIPPVPSRSSSDAGKHSKVKCVIGYDIVEGLSAAEYDEWLWHVHFPDLLANPNLDRIVLNSVIRPVRGEETFYRIAELHFGSETAYQAYLDWFAERPIPAERGPAGRTDFKFYVLCTVQEIDRATLAPIGGESEHERGAS